MSAPSVRLYLAVDDSLVTAANPVELDWAGTTPAATQVKIWNNKAGTGADTATDRRLNIEAREPGGEWMASGLSVLDGLHLEARVVSGVNQTVAATGWQPLGPGAGLTLPDLPNDAGVLVEIRPRPPVSVDDASFELDFKLQGPEALQTERGLSESAGVDGILSGLGDYRGAELWIGGDVVENPGGADEFVQVPDLSGTQAGVPWATPQQLVELDQDDGSAATLASGEAYFAWLTAGTAGVTTTKGDKATEPLDEDTDAPTPPAGEELLALVTVSYDAGGGLIEDADIQQRYTLGGLQLVETSGRTLTFGAGRARVDNGLIERANTQSITLDASETNSVYLRRTGYLTSDAEPGAYLIREDVVTDGSSVTDTGDDRRGLVGHTEVLIPVALDTLTTGGLRYLEIANGHHRPLYLAPEQPIMLWVTDLGSGNSTGGILVDVEMATETQAWASAVSLFTSSGARDLRPKFVHNQTGYILMAAVDATLYPHPEVRVIPPRARLRVIVDTEDLDATNPAGIRGYIRCALG